MTRARFETLLGRIRRTAADIVEEAGHASREATGLQLLRLDRIEKLRDEMQRAREEANDVLAGLIRGGH